MRFFITQLIRILAPHKKTFGFTCVVGFVAFAAVWAHVADQFERTTMAALHEMEKNGLIVHKGKSLSKFSLTFRLQKPSIKIPAFGGVLTYVTDGDVLLVHSFMNRRTTLKMAGDSDINFVKDDVVMPLASWSTKDNQNAIAIALETHAAFPQFLPQPTPAQTLQHIISLVHSVIFSARQLNVKVLTPHESASAQPGDGMLQTVSQYLDAFRQGLIVSADVVDYRIKPTIVEDSAAGAFHIVCKDNYMDENLRIASQGEPIDETHVSYTRVEGHLTAKPTTGLTLNEVLNTFIKDHAIEQLLSKIVVNVSREGVRLNHGYEQTYKTTVDLDGIQKNLAYASNGTGSFLGESWKKKLLPYLQLAVYSVGHELSDEALLNLLPNLEVQEPHQQRAKFDLAFKGEKVVVTGALGYTTHDHSADVRFSSPLRLEGCCALFDVFTTGTLSDAALFDGAITVDLALKQHARILDALENMAKRFGEAVKDTTIPKRIKAARLFADHWLARVGQVNAAGDVSLHIDLDINKDLYQLGNGRSYDDLIARFMPQIMIQGAPCEHGHPCNTISRK